MASQLKKFIPLADRVLVKRIIPLNKTRGGVILADSAASKGNHAEVIAAGPGRKDDNGVQIPMNCKVGDVVLLPEYGGTPIDLHTQEKEEYIIYSDVDILGKFE